MNNERVSEYLGKPIGELLANLSDHATPISNLHQEIKGAVQATLVQDLVSSIDRHERAASRLAKQVLILNIILGIFTVVGTILAAVAFVHAG